MIDRKLLRNVPRGISLGFRGAVTNANVDRFVLGLTDKKPQIMNRLLNIRMEGFEELNAWPPKSEPDPMRSIPPMHSRSRWIQFVAHVIILAFSSSYADHPGKTYSLDLGVENEDLEREIENLPWVQDPENGNVMVKDFSGLDFSGRDLRMSTIHFELKGIRNANFEGCVRHRLQTGCTAPVNHFD